MDFEYLVLWIAYSVPALVLFDIAERRLTRLQEGGSLMSYELYGKYILGTSIILLPALIGASVIGLVFAHLKEVTLIGFIVACCVFATCLPIGGWLMFSSLRSVEREEKEAAKTLSSSRHKGGKP